MPIPDALVHHETLRAKRKLNLIVRSHKIKKPSDDSINISVLFQVYIESDNAKTLKCIFPRPVLSMGVPLG